MPIRNITPKPVTFSSDKVTTVDINVPCNVNGTDISTLVTRIQTLETTIRDYETRIQTLERKTANLT
jgi:hypothetical protein